MAPGFQPTNHPNKFIFLFYFQTVRIPPNRTLYRNETGLNIFHSDFYLACNKHYTREQSLKDWNENNLLI